MRAVVLIFSLILWSCSDGLNNRLQLNHHVWVNEHLAFHTTYADGDSSIYSLYGSGTLLLFDTNHTIKSFSNTVINNNDSIAWGEPGIVLTSGKWRQEGTAIVANHTLIERTFVVGDDTIGSRRRDTFEFRGDTLIRNKSERFLPAGLLSQELNTFLHTDWSKIEKHNRR
jgi:hypothetical protein